MATWARRLACGTAILAATLGPAAAAAGPGPAPLTAGSGSAPREQEPAYDKDAVIVSFRDGVSESDAQPLLERSGAGTTLEDLDGVDAGVAAVDGDPEVVAERLEASAKVVYAEPDYLVSTASRPGDARFGEQWALDNRGQTRGGRPSADVGALRGWRRAGLTGAYPRSGGARVAVIDTGVQRRHPDLSGRIVGCARARPESSGLRAGGCDDNAGHGTGVAGTLVANADNGIGIAGVAFNSPLLVCRALGGRHETGRVSDIARCIDWARAGGAKVVSMSFATSSRSHTLERAMRRGWRGGGRRGMVLVAAAGNGGERRAAYPASFKQVVSVSATDSADGPTDFSNQHRSVELSAPGKGILSTARGGGYKRLSGTSMAAPHVAGAAALVRGVRPGMRASKVRRLLGRTADDLGPSGRDATFGHGRVDLDGAVRRARR